MRFLQGFFHSLTLTHKRAMGQDSVTSSSILINQLRREQIYRASGRSRLLMRGAALILFNVSVSTESDMTELLDRITINPAVRSGKPVIRGTRITVSDVLEYLASGMSEREILADFPDLSHEDILATLAFAAQREQRLFSAV